MPEIAIAIGIAIGIGIDKYDPMHCEIDEYDPDPDSDPDSESAHGKDMAAFSLNCSRIYNPSGRGRLLGMTGTWLW
jgi:hypothetical protein